MPDLLTTLLTKLDEPLARYGVLDAHYRGESPLSYLSPEARLALGNRLARVSVNLPRLLVDSVAERLRVVGFTRDGQPDADLWTDWLRNDLDQTSGIAHREALVLGDSYALVWGDAAGNPTVSIESARQVSVLVDPGTRRILAALKRWETPSSTEAVLYQADTITRLRANSTGATTAGFRTVETLRNPFGVPPVVRFRNGSRLLEEAASEMVDVLPLADAVTKLTTDLLVSSEYTARPRRWATGVELVQVDVLDDEGNPTGEVVDANPIKEDHRAMISEAPEAKFGQLQGSDLAGYENAIGVVMRQVSAVTGLPEHMLGIGGDNPTSADSIRASEAALTARAEARQQQFGRSWEQVAKLMHAVRTGVDPAGVDVSVQWADPSTRSTAQEADAVVKLHAAGILPTSIALERLGYTAADIARISSARRTDSLDTFDLGQVFR